MRSLIRRTKRAAALIAVATVAISGLSACGSGETEKAGSESGTGSFPVTIDSALGEATIETEPERIVTLGQGSAETAIALGKTPVGIEEYPWGSDDTGYLPWIHEAVTEAGDELPQQFTGGTEIDIEAIVELEPDVILAPWSGITQEQFDVLSDIATTVAYPELAWSTEWQNQIEIIGKALGKPEAAQEEIAKINDQFETIAKDNPEFSETSFVYTYTDGPGSLGVFLPGEQRVDMVSKMGLQVDPVVESLEETEGTASAVIGLENADKIKNSDLMFTFYSDAKSRKQIEAQELYSAIPAVERGSVVSSEDTAFVTASSLINPLTVPWVTEKYVPMIDEAIGKLER